MGKSSLWEHRVQERQEKQKYQPSLDKRHTAQSSSLSLGTPGDSLPTSDCLPGMAGGTCEDVTFIQRGGKPVRKRKHKGGAWDLFQWKFIVIPGKGSSSNTTQLFLAGHDLHCHTIFRWTICSSITFLSKGGEDTHLAMSSGEIGRANGQLSEHHYITHLGSRIKFQLHPWSSPQPSAPRAPWDSPGQWQQFWTRGDSGAESTETQT